MHTQIFRCKNHNYYHCFFPLFVQALDLTDSSFDNRCCDEIAALARTLKILKLVRQNNTFLLDLILKSTRVILSQDHCPRVETAGAATVLGRMRKLVQFDCDDKLQTLAAFGYQTPSKILY